MRLLTIWSFSPILTKAVTGAPLRSVPYIGIDWLWWPSRKAAVASSREAVTAPCPPLPWKRISINIIPE